MLLLHSVTVLEKMQGSFWGLSGNNTCQHVQGPGFYPLFHKQWGPFLVDFFWILEKFLAQKSDGKVRNMVLMHTVCIWYGMYVCMYVRIQTSVLLELVCRF